MSKRLDNLAYLALAIGVYLALAGGDGPLVPPGPTPAPGALHVVIVRETDDATPQFGELVVALRKGPAADYLASNKHRLTIADKHDQSALVDGLPSQPLPALFLLAGERVVHQQTIPSEATADNVIEIIRQNGG